jgi:hypothetical protein
MTCVLPTPFWRGRRAGAALGEARTGSVDATATLDHGSAEVRALVDAVGAAVPSHDAAAFVRAVHSRVAGDVRPVYSVDESCPASRTLRRGRGSCSQRLAVVEAASRAVGIPTRVRGLLVSGEFWYPRFPRLRRLVPRDVVIAWPELFVDGTWRPIDEIVARPHAASGSAPVCPAPFTNDSETLFDAAARTRIGWDAPPAGCDLCDLSHVVVRDLGRFGSRDALFARHGQTLCWPARRLTDPLLGRWSPAAAPAA